MEEKQRIIYGSPTVSHTELDAFHSFFKSTHKPCGADTTFILKAQLAPGPQTSADIKPRSLVGPVQHTWWENRATLPSGVHQPSVTCWLSAAAALATPRGRKEPGAGPPAEVSPAETGMS